MASAFSEVNPNLQTSWDASSLKSVQFCPRYYQMNNLEGWQAESTDLVFGRHIATGLELYQKARLDGKTREEAVIAAVRWALAETYNDADDTQWGGRYETLWKCNGDSKETVGKAYRNDKGNVAKCPFAHERAWFPGDAPDVCGLCGGSIRLDRQYIPEHTTKNRQSLIRALIWYGLDQPEELAETFHPYVFPNGTPAVELSGRLPLPMKAYTGEQYLLTYNIDYIGVWGDELFITDNKTTKKPLNDAFFQAYSPDTQFDTYDLIGSVAYPDIDIRGVMIEAIQLTAHGVEFGKRPFYKTEEQREEHLADLQVWITQAEGYARAGYWPMNKRSCWLCPFNKVCSLAPGQRQAVLEASFTKGERWNPTAER